MTVFLHQGFQLLDLAGPLDAMRAAAGADGRSPYRTRLVSRRGGLVRSNAGAAVTTVAVRESACDTLLVPGGDVARMLRRDEVRTVERLAAGATRIASVCTGAFPLAEVGLLDGRRATTHWSRVAELQRRYPAVSVEADRIFVADGTVWTSAGITAGIDLALALVEADHGAALARAVARELVVYHRRPGGQSQFGALSQMEPETDRIRRALTFARDHLTEPLQIERLATAAALSPRQFGRAFRRETGETPARAVERLRVEAARLRLDDGGEPVEVIARAVGFGDSERMRRAFNRHFGRPPQAVRQLARRTG